VAAGVSPRAQLGQAAPGLLQVVADDLLVLPHPGPGPGLEQAGQALVQVGPDLLGHALVDGVADQQVPELVAGLGGQAGRGGAQELAPHQPAQTLGDLGPGVRRGQGGHRVLLERLPDDRGPLQHVPVAAVQPVQAGRDQRLDGRRGPRGGQVAGHRPGVALAAQPALLDQGGQQLLDEQGVAAGGPGDPRPGRGRQRPAPGQPVQQGRRLLRSQWLQQHADGVGAAAGPGRTLLQQLGAGHRDQQDRRPAAALAQPLDQVQEGRLGPVQVVEDHHQGALGGQRLQQPVGRPGGLLDRGRVGLQPDQLPDPPGDQRPLGDGPLQQGGQLGPGLLGRVLKPDPGRLADHLGQRPEGAAVAVGQAAADQDRRVALQAAGRLQDQAGLAHPGPAEHGDQGQGRLGGRPLVRPLDQAQLGVAAHERGVEAAGAAGRPGAHGQQPVGRLAGPAACSSRAARLTASPTTRAPPRPGSPAITSPVSTPVCGSSRTRHRGHSSWLRRPRAACMSLAALTARRASSSWAAGMPKTAMIASPANFSTVPPWWRTTARMVS
jgi:hypothetical protein